MNMHEKEAMRQQGIAIASDILDHMKLKEWESSMLSDFCKSEDLLELLPWILEDEFAFDETALKQRLIKELFI